MLLLLVVVALAVPTHSQFQRNEVFSHVSSSYEDQVKYMRRCVALAEEAMKNGQAPVRHVIFFLLHYVDAIQTMMVQYGALIVDPRNRTIVSEGKNHASQNPIFHGEIDAINTLASKVKNVYDIAPYLELYTSAEPCPMCMSAILWSGFKRVYFGTSISYLEKEKLDQINIRAQYVANAATSFRKVEIVGGLLSNETNPLYDHAKYHNHDDHHHH